MEASISLGVCAELLALRINLSSVLQVRLQALGVVVRIDEVVPRVIGRVNVDHLDLSQIRLLEQLEHLEVVAFDDQVLSRIKVDALLW